MNPSYMTAISLGIVKCTVVHIGRCRLAKIREVEASIRIEDDIIWPSERLTFTAFINRFDRAVTRIHSLD